MTSYIRKTALIFLLGTLVVACGDKTAVTNQTQDPFTRYSCEPIADIGANYNGDTVTLDIGEEKYTLNKVENKEEGIDAAYATEQGVDGENGMQWLVFDGKKQAKIRTMSLDQESTPETEVVLYDCKITEDNAEITP